MGWISNAIAATIFSAIFLVYHILRIYARGGRLMAPRFAVGCPQSGISFIVGRSSIKDSLQFVVFSKTIAIRTRWRIAAYLESDGCCASWNSWFYYDRTPFVINSGCLQDSRGLPVMAAPTGGQGHAQFFYCPLLLFSVFYCSFLLFTIIQQALHRIRSGTPIMASPTSRAPPRELSIVAARRGRRGGRLCCPFWQPPCASC